MATCQQSLPSCHQDQSNHAVHPGSASGVGAGTPPSALSGDHGDAIIFIGKGNLFSTPIIVAASGAVTKQNNDEN